MTSLLRLVLLLATLLALSAPSSGSVSKESASVFDADASAQQNAAEKAKNLERNVADDRVHVLYCTACGYEANFKQVKAYLEETFPHLVDRVTGANYDVDPTKKMLSQAVNVAQATAMILLVFGEYLLPAVGLSTAMLQWPLNNRIPSFFIVLFMGSLASSLTASGAFEIYFNDDLIFSKLQLDRWPSLQELSNSIKEYGLLDNISA